MHKEHYDKLNLFLKNNPSFTKEEIWAFKSSTRFFPFWDFYRNNQIEGLMNMMFYVYEKNKNIKDILEIGSHIGESASIFLSFPFINEIYCVDTWEDETYFKIFNERMKKYILNKKCFFVKNSSELAENKIKKDFDLIYIDADHTYFSVKKDLSIWSKKLKPQGFLCGHDYGEDWLDVKKAVDEFISNNLFYYKDFKTFNDSSWCLQKI